MVIYVLFLSNKSVIIFRNTIHLKRTKNRKKAHNNCFFKFTITFTYAHKIIETSDVMLKIHFLFSYINISYHLTLERNTDFYTQYSRSLKHMYMYILLQCMYTCIMLQGWVFFITLLQYSLSREWLISSFPPHFCHFDIFFSSIV